MEVFAKSSVASYTRAHSVFCFEKARMTLLPERFSRESNPILSNFFCIAEKIGILRFIMNHKTNAIRTAAAKNISDSLRLIVIAMISEPAIMNGARVSRRIIIAILC